MELIEGQRGADDKAETEGGGDTKMKGDRETEMETETERQRQRDQQRRRRKAAPGQQQENDWSGASSDNASLQRGASCLSCVACLTDGDDREIVSHEGGLPALCALVNFCSPLVKHQRQRGAAEVHVAEPHREAQAAESPPCKASNDQTTNTKAHEFGIAQNIGATAPFLRCLCCVLSRGAAWVGC